MLYVGYLETPYRMTKYGILALIVGIFAVAMVLAALWLLEVIFFLVADTSTSSGTQGALSFFTFVCAAVSMFVTFSLRQRVRELEAECAALRALLTDAHRELATIEAITVSPSGVDGLIELVNRIGQKLESSK